MKKRKIFLCKNFAAGALGLAFGMGMMISAGSKSGIYPKILFGGMCILGIYILTELFWKGSDSGLERVKAKEVLWILLLFINPLLGKMLGFYASGFLTLLGISALTRRPENLRAWCRMALYLVLVTMGTYLVFSVLLRIHTPRGILI